MKPLVIFLNGTSSSGKSSIAAALQGLYQTPLLHTGIDSLYDMLPKQAVGTESMARYGYYYVMRNGLLDHIEVGESAQKLLKCVVPLTRVLLDHGNDLVIDEILFSGEGRVFLHEYADIFASARAYFIKIECPLAVLEAREAQRPDRHRGVAREQFLRVHNHGYRYDLTVNTSISDAQACAQQIMEYIQREPEPVAFADVRAGKRQ
ncbi:MAG: chloramphenicol phosphotransferase [Candidatus Dependentiae bacterium]|nr:chloramphenicol phosphotransferase [Candidatus Dependentiae bacterium]